MATIALFSDTHSVVSSLTAMQDDALAGGAERFWNLGDTAGYGTQPRQTIEAAMDMMEDYPESITLLGNHDAAILERYLYLTDDRTVMQLGDNLVGIRFRSEAHQIVQTHRRTLKQERNKFAYEWLEERPIRANPFEGYYLAHGSYPQDPANSVWEYATRDMSKVRTEFMAMPDFLAQEIGSDTPFRFLAVGHYHVPGIWRWDSDENTIKYFNPLADASLWDKTLVFDDLAKNPIIVNPGSITFPRRIPTHKNVSAYMLLKIDEGNLDRIEICLRKNAFDWQRVSDFINDQYPRADELREELALCADAQERPSSNCFTQTS